MFQQPLPLFIIPALFSDFFKIEITPFSVDRSGHPLFGFMTLDGEYLILYRPRRPIIQPLPYQIRIGQYTVTLRSPEKSISERGYIFKRTGSDHYCEVDHLAKKKRLRVREEIIRRIIFLGGQMDDQQIVCLAKTFKIEPNTVRNDIARIIAQIRKLSIIR